MNDDSIATHMHCHVLSVLLTGPGKKKKKKKKKNNNIHEPSSSLILSAFYIVISSIILSVLFLVFFPFIIETLNDKQYLKRHHQS